MRDFNLRHVFVPLVALALLSGCSVRTHEESPASGDQPKKEDVDIRTPFGSLSVHTGATSAKDTGLADYPGARIQKDVTDRHGDNSANVNISSSLFGLKLVVLKFESNDSPEKVMDFYRKDMARYGKVLDCTGNIVMNFHRHDQDAPVSCDSHGGSHENYKQELKVGTENNQRVVAVKPTGSGSSFALVYVRARGDEQDTQ